MINLNYRDSRPIYEQIKDSIVNLTISGVLSTDDKLPSVRELATQLAINPNTIQRAYRELETSGYIYSIPGKGSFIAENDATGKKIEALFKRLEDCISELKHLGVSQETIISRLIEEGGKTV